MDRAHPDGARRWVALARATGWTGIVAMVALFVPIVALGSLGEPPLQGEQDEVVEFFRNASEAGWVESAATVSTIGFIVMLWFVVGLATVLRAVEGAPAWRSTVTLASGLLFVAYGLLDVSWEAGVGRVGDLDPSVVHLAYDLGNRGFVNVWAALASFAVSAAWVGLATGTVARWACWVGIAGGLGLVVAQFVWTTELWFLPYALFWVWFVATCVTLVRRPERFTPA